MCSLSGVGTCTPCVTMTSYSVARAEKSTINLLHNPVTPVKRESKRKRFTSLLWIPAYAGMTILQVSEQV